MSTSARPCSPEEALSALTAFATQLAEAATVPAALGLALRTCVLLTGALRAAYWRYEPSRTRFVIDASLGPGPGVGTIVSVREGQVGPAVRGELRCVRREELAEHVARQFEQIGLRASILAPLPGQIPAPGVLGASFATELTRDDPRVERMRTLAAMLAGALARLKLEDEARSLRADAGAEHCSGAGAFNLDLVEGGMTLSSELRRLLEVPHGATPQEQLAHFWRSVHPADMERVRVSIQRVTAHGGVLEDEHRLVLPAGSVRHVQTRAHCVHDDGGQIVAVRGTVHDVSAFREQEAESARFFSLSSDPHVVFGPDLVLRRANDALGAVLGVPVSTLVGQSAFAFIHPDDALAVVETLGKGLRKGPIELVACRVRTRDGSWRRIAWKATVGAEGLLYAVGRDVTAEHEAALRVRTLQAVLEDAQELANLGSWERDLRTNEVTWTPQVYRILGIDPSQPASNEAYLECVPQDERETIDAARRAAMAGSGEWSVEHSVVNGAHRRVVLARGRILRDANGEETHWRGALLDITERKAQEDALVRAREDALAASRAKSTFLANMSHEIRTPMNGILGMTALALETELDPEQAEYLRAVQVSAQNLLAIIDGILDLSKIEARKLHLDAVPFSLPELVAGTLRALMPRAEQAGLSLWMHLDPRLSEGRVGDPLRLGQVLTNLVGNALKFTQEGEVAVRVRPGEAPGELWFSVADTGPGIHPQRHSAIFEAFTQEDGSTTRRYGGTGLGLTISRELVTLMGGRIWVESLPGEGSTFHFTARVGVAANARPWLRPDERLRGLRVRVAARSEGVTRSLAKLVDGLGAVVCEDAEVVLCEPELAPKDATPRVLLCSVPLPLARRAGAHVLFLPPTPAELAAALLGVRAKMPAHADGATAVPSPAPGRLRVLVAEDNEINTLLLRRLLERLGHRVTHAADGLAALELCARETFDAVLMDVQMPRLDGLEATRRIRALPDAAAARVPVIALTANAMKGDDETCLAAGMDAYLAKPVQPEALRLALERVSEQAGRSAPA